MIKFTKTAAAAATAMVAAVIAVGQVHAGSDQTTAQPSAAPSQSDSGLKVYIDPQTGQIRSEPAPGTEVLQIPAQQQSPFSTSHEGLVEVPAPGGGVKIDLQGRFQTPLIATTDADGRVKMMHPGEMQHSDDHK